MKLKKYIEKKISTAKKENGWKRISKKRLEIVFSGNEKKNLKQAIKRHQKDITTKAEKDFILKLSEIGVINTLQKKVSQTAPIPVANRKQIYKDEVLFWELVEDLETAFVNLNLKKCFIVGQNGSYSGRNISEAIKETRSMGEMKAYSGDFINNVLVDVFVVSYNNVKTEMEIIITDSYEYQRPKRMYKGKK